MAIRSDERIELLTAHDEEKLLNISCKGIAIATAKAKKKNEPVCVTINGLTLNGYVVYSYPRKSDFRTGIRFDITDIDREVLRASLNAFAGGVPINVTINMC